MEKVVTGHLKIDGTGLQLKRVFVGLATVRKIEELREN